MRLQPEVPTAEDAVRHFQDMAHGRLPRRKNRKRRLFGGWGGDGPTYMKTTLVTPTAMAMEQAKSQLRERGELPSIKRRPRKPPTKRKKPTGRKTPAKKPIKGRVVKKTAQSPSRRRRVKT